jgi:hypothetical protein
MPARSAFGKAGHAITSSLNSGHFAVKCAKEHAKFSASDS